MSVPMPNESPSIILIPHSDIVPSKTQPRTHFEPEKMAALKASLRANGFDARMSHLLVRPFEYRSGPAHDARHRMTLEVRASKSSPWERARVRFDIPRADEEGVPSWAALETEADVMAAIEALPKYELIDGERRWRMAGELIEAGEIADEVPAMIAPLDDVRTLELQLVSVLQREALTPMEEAEGIARLLELRDAEDAALYTRASLAAKLGFGPMHITRQLKVARLKGTMAGDALEAGKLTASHAVLLAGVPAGELRDALTKRVLAGGPMPVALLDLVISEEVIKDLRRAPFDREDAALVPVVFEDEDEHERERVFGGECGVLERHDKKMSWTCPFVINGQTSSPMCSNPECFRAKTLAAHERWMMVSVGANVTALSLEEGVRVFDHSGRNLRPGSGYVEMEDLPDAAELRSDAGNSLSWAKLIKGQAVMVTLAKDAAGKVHELVSRELAKKAAHQNGHKIFRDSGEETQLDEEQSVTGAASGDSAAESKAETLEKKADRERANALKAAEIGAIVAAAERCVRRGMLQLPKDFWGAVAASLLDAVSEAELLPEMETRRGGEISVEKASLGARLGLVVECLALLSEEREVWAKVFGVKLGLVRRQVEKKFGKQEARKAAA